MDNPRGESGRPEVAIYGHLYVAWVGDRAKIGITTNPERRRRQIETSTGEKVREWAEWHVYAPGACERCVHKRYGWLRTSGEWFEEGKFIYDDLCRYLDVRAARQ